MVKTLYLKYQKHMLLLCFIFLFIVIGSFLPVFLRPANLINVLKQASITGILTMGVGVLVISGSIDLSAGAGVALTTVSVALMARAGVPIYIAFFVAIFIGIILGLINGLIVSRAKIVPFIATLATSGIYGGLASIASSGIPIAITDKSYTWLGNGTILGIPVPVVFFLVIYLFFRFILKRTKMGRYAYAMGGNPVATAASGINIDKYRLFTYIIMGALIGLAGMLLSARIQTGANSAGLGLEFDALIACIIGGIAFSGGVGSVTGAVIGLGIIGIINNSLDLLGVLSYYQAIIKGIIIIITMTIDSKKNSHGS